MYTTQPPHLKAVNTIGFVRGVRWGGRVVSLALLQSGCGSWKGRFCWRRGWVGIGLVGFDLFGCQVRLNFFLRGRVSPPSPRHLRTMEIRHHGPELASARPRSRWFISRFATRLSPRRLQVPESVGCRTLNRGVPLTLVRGASPPHSEMGAAAGRAGCGSCCCGPACGGCYR